MNNLTIQQAHDALVAKKITVADLVSSYIQKAQKENAAINGYLEIFTPTVEEISAAQKRIDDGTSTLLTGIPIAIKDNILIKGRIASSASKILEKYVAPYDATVISKLKEAGALFIGRTNMDEFAMGGSTENSAYGEAKNPHDTSRVPGGTSGGAAAVLAADLCIGSIGSDTGGSVRQPASFCGVVGLKPSYGSISRYGLMAMTSSFDQIGPMGKTVADTKILFDTLKGEDGNDATSLKTQIPEKKQTKRIGVPWHTMKEGVDKDVLDNFKNICEKLKTQGYEIVDIEVPALEQVLPIYYIIMFAEVSSNMARYDGIKYGYRAKADSVLNEYLKTRAEGLGKEVKRRILLGTYVLSAGYYDAFYAKADKARSFLTQEVTKTLLDLDAIMTPTSPFPAFKIGERSHDPLAMYIADIFTVTANLTKLPAISVPSGTVDRDGKKLPLGIQCTASSGQEETLFTIASVIEQVRES